LIISSKTLTHKATQAEKTARQTHANADIERNDQKAAKLAQELEQKKTDCKAKEQQYQVHSLTKPLPN
jgi:hypothetical protein